MNKIYSILLQVLFIILISSCNKNKVGEITLESKPEQTLGSSLFFNFPVKYRLTPGEEFQHVTSVTIKNKPLLTLDDIDFSKFPSLDTLCINNTLLIDATPVKDSITKFNLRYIDLSDNKISSCLSLSKFEKVEYLSLKDNFLINFPEVQQLKNLNELDLRDNQISFIPEPIIGNLKKLGISGNPAFCDSTCQYIKKKYPNLVIY